MLEQYFTPPVSNFSNAAHYNSSSSAQLSHYNSSSSGQLSHYNSSSSGQLSHYNSSSSAQLSQLSGSGCSAISGEYYTSTPQRSVSVPVSVPGEVDEFFSVLDVQSTLDGIDSYSQTKVTSPDSMPTTSTMSHTPYGMCSSISPGQYVSSASNVSMYQSPENIPEPVGAARAFQPSTESRMVNQQTGEPSPLLQPGFTKPDQATCKP